MSLRFCTRDFDGGGVFVVLIDGEDLVVSSVDELIADRGR
jgi:hypothetical protein